MGEPRQVADIALVDLLGLAWEAEVAIDGERLDGTAQRLATIGSALSWTPASLRLGVFVEVAPPLGSLSANTVCNVRTGWTLGYAL